MTVNSYLTNLAADAVIRDAAKQGIQRSIVTLQSRLAIEFTGQLSDHFVFGSYSRGTILPRYMDENSDIDYMVVFKDGSYRPQTYLDRLRRFVERYYARSEIFQSNPTVVLSLNHIKFELVPAIPGLLWGQQIPARASAYQDWMYTNPNSFNHTLTEANKNNNNLIKPLVRLVKYWNARNGYVFDSYELEQKIAEGSYFGLGLFFGSSRIETYLYEVFRNLDLPWTAPQWKHERLTRAQSLVSKAKGFQSYGDMEHLAEREIERLLPRPSALASLLGGI